MVYGPFPNNPLPTNSIGTNFDSLKEQVICHILNQIQESLKSKELESVEVLSKTYQRIASI